MRSTFLFTLCLGRNALSISGEFSAAVRRSEPSPASGADLITILSNGASVASRDDERYSSAAASIVSSLTENRGVISPEAESVQSMWGKMQAAFVAKYSDLFSAARAIAASGLVPSDILSFLNDYLKSDLNSVHNDNPPLTNADIYPSKAIGDAPFSVPEEDLRAAIHIPSAFSYGKNGKKPLILVPGTAIPAGTTFYFNFAHFANAAPHADIVWVNIPRASLSDAQVNAEYVAYVINYISSISQSNVATLGWSQGSLNVQWALKYWPSTRLVVDDFIAVSPDFHGTVVRELACPLLEALICTPSLWQQGWKTEFIHTIRNHGGDSAYVPTTTIYSSFDEIVQPMSGKHASAIMLDSRNVGVTNNHIQEICPKKPAGGLYTHEGLLYNPLAWKLAADAFNNDGPGQVARIDTHAVCSELVAPQLGPKEMLGTHGILLVAVAELLSYLPKTTGEPEIVGYASK